MFELSISEPSIIEESASLKLICKAEKSTLSINTHYNEKKILTIVVNDNIDNCSISDVFIVACQTRNEVGLSWSESQQNSVLILQSDLIIESEETNVSGRIVTIDYNTCWCQMFKVRRATYSKRCKL